MRSRMMDMKNVIAVKDIVIGTGRPKICVPLVGVTIAALKAEAENISLMDVNLVEWRVDFFQEVEKIERVKEALAVIRLVLPNLPLIFTFRTAKEGGEHELSTQDYQRLNEAIMQTNAIDLIDIELFTEEKVRDTIIKKAQIEGVKVIVSNHDFEKTPAKEEIIMRLKDAELIGADIGKIAVMPNEPRDVVTLLAATEEMYSIHAHIPIITMAMGGLGLVSRLAGEVFGSCLTFATADHASAPGQIRTDELEPVLSMIHQNLGK